MSGEVREQTDLATWLGQCIDDDERTAHDAIQETTGRWSDRETDWGGGAVVEDDGGALILPSDRSGNAQYPHIARWDPARVLAECDTKRRILQIHNTYDAIFGNDPDDPDPDDRCIGCAFGSDERPMTEHIDKCPVLRALALPYVDRPGYREEWKP